MKNKIYKIEKLKTINFKQNKKKKKNTKHLPIECL